jgi:hypothetical protein
LPTAWQAPKRKPSRKEWAYTLTQVSQVYDCLHFWIGDLINYGECTYGETYSQWLDLFAYSTVSRDAWVCREIPREIRRPPDLVPFSTHVILAPARFSVEEKDWWLRLCADEGWSGDRLKREIKQHDALMAGGVEEPADFIVISNFSNNGRDGPGAEGFAGCEPFGSDIVQAGARSIPCPHCGGLVPLPYPKGEVIK